MRIKFFLPLLSILTTIVLSYWSLRPIFIQGFFPMHDNTQIARVFEMGKVLKDGIFPARWVPDLGYGYGYPLFNYYAPLAYYIGGFVNVLGFDALYSTKIMMGLGVLLSGITMYFFAKEFFGKLGGIVSALFYVYAPYHAVQIYVRGAVGEYFGYAFIPLIFLGMYKVFLVSFQISQTLKFKNKLVHLLPWIILGAIGFAGVILSHNLTAMMVTPFLLFFIIALSIISYQKQHKFTIYSLLFTLFLGVLLSAFYWLPAILEMKYTNVTSQLGGSADFHEHFVCLSQLWDSSWGFGGSTAGCIDGLSLKVGKLHLMVVIIGIIAVFIKNNVRTQKTIVFLMAIFLVLSMFLTTNASRFLWEAIKPMEYIQYPWRFLAFASFFSSFLIGGMLYIVEMFGLTKERTQIGKTMLFISVTTILISFSIRIFQPQNIFQTQSSDFTNEKALKWNASKTSDEYMPKNFNKPATGEEIIKETIKNSPSIRVSNIVENSYSLQGTIEVLQSTSIFIRKAPFPEWELFIQGKKHPMENTPNGYKVRMPPGIWNLHLKYQSTQIQQIANILSIAGITFVIIGIIYLANQRKNDISFDTSL